MKETIQATGKRKSAIARATIREGSGRVHINDRALDVFEPELARLKIKEPLRLVEENYGDINLEDIDIKVNVSGGGYMGQADASRTAIAKGLVEWGGDEDLYKVFKDYDETLVKSDTRRKESKKPGGRGARRKRQKSYR